MFQKPLDLENLVNLEEWQKVQDSFSDVLEVTLRTVSPEGKLVSKASRPSRLCNEILPKTSSSHSDFCKYLAKTGAKLPIDLHKKTNFKCALGLDVFVIPIMATGNRTVTYIIMGPLILKSRKTKSEYANDAKKLGIELEKLMDALIEMNVFTYNKIYSMTKLIESTFSHMAQTGYHKKRLGEIAPQILEVDPLFSRYYEEKILNALLKSCAIALDADSGSVMTVDNKNHVLHIKVSTKLDKDIIDKANIKMGEGIAGFAAATAQPIILPQDENKNGLSGKMKRKDIKSSMIVPFDNVSTKENGREVYGVLNLNIVRKDRDFSKKDVALVKELLHLASVALGALQQAK
jgi:ligand-binding sensor protein